MTDYKEALETKSSAAVDADEPDVNNSSTPSNLIVEESMLSAQAESKILHDEILCFPKWEMQIRL